MNRTTRDLAIIAVFGGVWGALELSIGSILHVVFPPFTDTFMVGIIMGGLAALVALVGRQFVPVRGSVFSMAVVAALLKAANVGGATIGPLVAILAEGVLMELALLIPGSIRRGGFVLAGALATAWSLPHKFILQWLLYGQGLLAVAKKMVKDGSALLHVPAVSVLAVLGLLLTIRLVVGALAGWVAWDLGQAVRRRTSRDETT